MSRGGMRVVKDWSRTVTKCHRLCNLLRCREPQWRSELGRDRKARDLSGLDELSLARLAAEVHNRWRWYSASRLGWVPSSFPTKRGRSKNEDSHCHVVALI